MSERWEAIIDWSLLTVIVLVILSVLGLWISLFFVDAYEIKVVRLLYIIALTVSVSPFRKGN